MSTPLTTQDVNALIARLEHEGYNMLIPPGFLLSASPAFRVTFREHRIRAIDPKGKEVYQSKSTGADFALSAVTLFKLGTLAGVTFDQHPERGCRWLQIQDGVLQYQAVGAIKNADGSPLIQPASKTIFYEGRRPAEFETEKVETKAKCRVIRQLLGVKSVYTRVELEKPFAVLVVELAIDMSNPQVQLMLAEKAIATMTNVFGVPATPAMLSPQTLPAMIPGAAPAQLLPSVSESSRASAGWEDAEDDPSLAEAAAQARSAPAAGAQQAQQTMAPPPAVASAPAAPAQEGRIDQVRRLAQSMGLTDDEIRLLISRNQLKPVNEQSAADFHSLTTQLMPDLATGKRQAAAARVTTSGDPY